jgi:hypothetical protein
MAFRVYFLMPVFFFIACGSRSENEPTPPPSVSAEAPTQTLSAKTNANSVHLRALFYMERIQANGQIKGWPTKPDSPTVGPGEQAWLEVHTNGAAHAYAFALFGNGRVSTLWTEALKKGAHAPPMNAFGEGLGLSAAYEFDAKLLVVASKTPLLGLKADEDCSQPSEFCTQLKQWSVEAGKDKGNHIVQMRQGELRVPAFGRMGEGQTVAAIQFDFMDAGR